MIRIMEALRGSASQYKEMVSEKRISMDIITRERGRETASPRNIGLEEPMDLSDEVRLVVSATNLEIAVWKPAAVREKESAITGPVN